MASKQLTARVKIDTRSAISNLTRLSKKIRDVQKAADRTTKNVTRLNKQIKSATTSANRLNAATNRIATATSRVANTTRRILQTNRQATTSAQRLGKAYNSANTFAKGLLSTMKRLFSVYMLFQGAKALVNTTDTIISAKNKFNNIEGGSEELTSEALNKTYAASMRSRSNYADMLSNVSKTMILAGDSFQNNVDNAIRFQEIMAKAYTVGGASAQEQSTSMYQLVQSLGGGILAGDELRSVREGAPLAYKKIEKFAQGVFNSKESLKDLASQGVITSDIVVAAIMNSEEEIDKAFNNTKITFGQTADKIKNMATMAFMGVAERFEQMLNSEGGRKAVEAIGYVIVKLGDLLLGVINAFDSFFNWCADNWDWLKWIVIGVTGALIAAIALWTAKTVANAIIQIGAWIAVNWQILLIYAAIAVVVAGIVWLAQVAKTGSEFICKALWLIAIAALVVGAIIALVTGGVVLLVIGIILAAIALIVTALAYCGEETMGIIYAIGAGIYNIVAGVVNACIQAIYFFIDPVCGIVEWIFNAFLGGFNGIGGACANLVGQMCSWFLSLGKIVTKIIDAIFGTNWSDGLSSLQDKVLAWGKNDDAITLNREAPTLSDAGDKLGVNLPDRIAYGDAYASGAKTGAKIESGINSFGNKAKGAINSLDLGAKFDSITAAGGAGDLTNGNGLINPTADAYKLSGGYDPSIIEDDIKNAADKLGNIEDDTGSIKDSLDLKDEDFEYLRKIAEMEWRNEFTTAEIKIDMTNNNNINGERDLDGIVYYLAEKLHEEMTSIAYGVHG